MSVIMITEDREILESIKYFLEKEFGRLIPEVVKLEERFLYRYKINKRHLFTLISGGKDKVLRDFTDILSKYYKHLKEVWNVKAIFLYFDKDAGNEIKEKIKKIEDLEIDFNQGKGKYKDFDIYLSFLGKELELCDLRIKPEFETLLLENEKEDIEDEEKLCEIIKSKEINKASLIFPLKMIVLYKEKPDIKVYLSKSKLNLRNNLKIEEIVSYFK